MERPPQENLYAGIEDFEKLAEAIKGNMKTALASATSEEDAKARIKEVLPKDRSFLGPMVIFDKNEETSYVSAMVQTVENGQAVDIEAHHQS